MILGNFNFVKKDDYVLLTNDTGAFCFLKPEDLQAIIHGQKLNDSEKWNELCEKHFCSDDSEESFIRNNENAIRDANSYLFDSTSLFIFAITNECNNRCVYCQANGEKKSCHMQEDVAEKALEQIARTPAANITIEFQGGEPLINFPIIRFIITRSKELLPKKNIQFTIVSNLSLLTPEMAAFFKENSVAVSTSLDGPEMLHDLNRPSANGISSFKDMLKGKAILDQMGIIPGVIETTTAYSLRFPEEIVDTYVQNGFKQLFIRPLTKLGSAKKSWDTIGYTPEQFLAFYKKALERIIWYNSEGVHLTEYHAALFLAKILNGTSVNYMELRSPCGAGLGQIAITANGNVYTCDEGRMMAEMGDEAFRIGNVFENGYNDWIESSCCKAICSASLLDTLPGCCDCVYKPYCGVCPVINYAINGNITNISKDRCKIYKGILDLLFEYIKMGNSEIMNIFGEWRV